MGSRGSAGYGGHHTPRISACNYVTTFASNLASRIREARNEPQISKSQRSGAARLLFLEPALRFLRLGVIEVLDFCCREGLAEDGHALLPLRLTDYR